MNVKIKRMLLLNLPYVLIALLATKLGEAWRYSPGLDISQKVLHLMDGFPLAFQSLYPSLLPSDLILGAAIAAGIKLAVYLKGRNAKKYRKNIEYGSARWGRPRIDTFYRKIIQVAPKIRKGGSQTPEHWLSQTGTVAQFGPEYAERKQSDSLPISRVSISSAAQRGPQ